MKSKHYSALSLLAAALLIANGAYAQWSRNTGTGQTYVTVTSDFVGIGTTNPLYKLDVQSSGIATMQFKSTNNNASILLERGSATSTSSLTYKSAGVGKWQTGIIANDNYNIRNNGLAAPAITCLFSNNNVGIGTPNPTQKLHVTGNILATGNIDAVNVTASGTVSTAGVISSGNINAVNFVGSGNIDVSGYIGFGSVEQFTDGGANTIASNSNLVPLNDCSSSLGLSTRRWSNVFACGKISAGTTTGVGAQLSVAYTALLGIAGVGSFQIGETNTANLVMDDNEIQSRNNGVASTFFINNSGGNIVLDGTASGSNVGIGTSAPTSDLHIVHENVFNTNGITIDNNFAASLNWNIYTNTQDDLWLSSNGVHKGSFSGTSGVYTPLSDRKFKKDVVAMDNVIEKVMKLNPTLYHFKTQQNSTDRKFIGLIAQDVQPLFPEAVYENSGKNDGTEDFLTLDYSSFSVIAIKAIQEQQKEITELKQIVKQLDQSLAQCCMSYGEKSAVAGSIATDAARLEQNAPNPFSEKTFVKFYIPQNFKSAIVKIYSMNGEEMKSFSISASGLGQVEIMGNSMASGVYQYTLLIDGKAVDSKQMILTK